MDKGLMLRISEDGVASLYEEPYATIECKTEEDYNMLVERIEKGTPQKVSEIDVDYGYFDCPSCDNRIWYGEEYLDHKHCLNCGQGLGWGNDQ